MKNKRFVLGGFFILLLTLIAWLSYSAINSTGFFKPKPNIVVILTDDLDFTLMPYMENTNELLVQKGTSFTNYLVASPLCCPSRATMLRGQYPHNTNILENSPGFRRFYLTEDEKETVAVWLNNKGYETSLLGKYLNGYPVSAGRNYVPPGWTDWHVFMYQMEDSESGNFYYGYWMNENGELNLYGDHETDYSTDIIKERSMLFMEQSMKKGSPFFVIMSVYAPHGPSIPAPRHAEMYDDLEYPQRPSFGETDLSDKPSTTIAEVYNGDEFDVYDANALFKQRVRSMQAVDELVRETVQLLEDNGQLYNTYILFTSDNGFHMGEHGLPSGKDFPYDEDIRVPLIIRGPGIQPNTTISHIVSNIDLAPTIADMAGVPTASFVDGRSMMPLLDLDANTIQNWRSGLLIEIGYTERDTSPLIYRGIRTEKFLYVEYKNGEIEFYDRVSDPFEMNNIAGELDPQILSSLHTWLNELKSCEAETCKSAEENPPTGLENIP